jgi:hypothetical protein
MCDLRQTSSGTTTSSLQTSGFPSQKHSIKSYYSYQDNCAKPGNLQTKQPLVVGVSTGQKSTFTLVSFQRVNESLFLLFSCSECGHWQSSQHYAIVYLKLFQ